MAFACYNGKVTVVLVYDSIFGVVCVVVFRVVGF